MFHLLLVNLFNLNTVFICKSCRNFINRYFQYMKVQQHQIRVYYNTAMKRLDFKQELTSPKFISIFFCHVSFYLKNIWYLISSYFKYLFKHSLSPQRKLNISWSQREKILIYKILSRRYISLAHYWDAFERNYETSCFVNGRLREWWR